MARHLVHAVALLAPALAIARADFVEADELELRDVERRPSIRQTANAFGEVQPALRFGLVAHPVMRQSACRPSAWKACEEG